MGFSYFPSFVLPRGLDSLIWFPLTNGKRKHALVKHTDKLSVQFIFEGIVMCVYQQLGLQCVYVSLYIVIFYVGINTLFCPPWPSTFCSCIWLHLLKRINFFYFLLSLYFLSKTTYGNRWIRKEVILCSPDSSLKI